MHKPKAFWLFIACSCLVLLLGCQASSKPPNGLTVKIERVVSGQTLEWLNPTKQPALLERVRLIGIEAPDLRQQPWGYEAKRRLEQLLGTANNEQATSEPILLESDIEEIDRFGRRLGYIWKDSLLLNEELVKEGYVLFSPRSPNNKYDRRLARAQDYARTMGKGIWDPTNPMRMAPSEFQYQNR